MKREPKARKSMQETLALCITRGTSDGQLKVDIKLCTIGECEPDGRRYPYSPTEVDGLYLEHAGLGYVDYWSDYESGHLMTGDLGYYDGALTLNEQKLKRMLKTIRTVGRKLAKVRDTIGSARTADEQLAHLALALGINTVFIYDPERKGNGRDWVCTDVAYGRGAIVEWAALEQTRRGERRTAGGM
jgi:hypothetical protein